MKHIIFYSGGLGSWATFKKVSESVNINDIICLFTDTLIEDVYLYKFLLETIQEAYGVDNSDLIYKLKHIPEISHDSMEDRKSFLIEMSKESNSRNDNFIWISDGRDPWDVFNDNMYIGNSRLAQCSHELKQDVAKKYIYENFNHDECVLYLGIDWTEEHRTKAPTKNWHPYKVRFPLCQEPYINKVDIVKKLEELNIDMPRLYNKGYFHNNCLGFCVRAGQGHFIHLLRTNRNLYLYHEEKELELIDKIGKDVSMLQRTRNKKRERVTMRQLREEYERKDTRHIDMNDIGGCGCFVDD